jgi:hypothetical protein
MYCLYPWGCVEGLICHKGFFLGKRGEWNYNTGINRTTFQFVRLFVCMLRFGCDVTAVLTLHYVQVNFTSAVYLGSGQLLCISAFSTVITVRATCFTFIDSASCPVGHPSVSCDTALERLDVIEQTQFEISRFRREVDENCALLGCYAASSGNSLTDVSGQPIPKRQ